MTSTFTVNGRQLTNSGVRNMLVKAAWSGDAAEREYAIGIAEAYGWSSFRASMWNIAADKMFLGAVAFFIGGPAALIFWLSTFA